MAARGPIAKANAGGPHRRWQRRAVTFLEENLHDFETSFANVSVLSKVRIVRSATLA
jgi:hypothetical protein